MTADPARQLADTGWRVLQTMRPLVALPGSYRLPGAYQSLLLDPMAALSDVCHGLLGWQPAAPVATRHEGSAGEPEGHLHPERVRQGENPAATRPDAPGLGGTPSLEQVRRAMEAPLVPFPDGPGSALGLPDAPATTHPGVPISPAHDTRPADRPRQPAGSDSPEPLERLDHYAGIRRTTKHESLGPDAPYPIERSPAGGYPSDPDRLDGEPSPEDRDETQRLARRELPVRGRSFPVDNRPAGIERLAAADPISGMLRAGSTPSAPDAAGTPPAGETRLATSASRLAAMLRADAIGGGTDDDFPQVTQDGAAFPIRSKSGGTGDPVEEERTRLDGRVGVEEIMERLADELETGFVRTYGSSGG